MTMIDYMSMIKKRINEVSDHVISIQKSDIFQDDATPGEEVYGPENPSEKR